MHQEEELRLRKDEKWLTLREGEVRRRKYRGELRNKCNDEELSWKPVEELAQKQEERELKRSKH